jgi:serine O-acetyltransferase
MGEITEPLNLHERLARTMASKPLGKLARLSLKLLTVEIPQAAEIGPGLRLPHGAAGLVIHPSTTIGANVRIFQGVTIGRGDQWVPGQESAAGGIRIGDGAVIGTGAKILFSSGQFLTIGEGAIIGANAVVTRDVPANEIWAGIPARKVRDRPDRD